MATTPSWVVQKSPTEAVSQPKWVVSSGSTTTPKSTGFDPSKEGKYEGAFDYLSGGIGTDTIQNQGQWVGGEGGSYQDNFVDTRDHGVLNGMVSVKGRDTGGEDAIGNGPSYELQYDKMPNQGMTKFGRIDNVYRVQGLGDVIDPRGVVWDDNYGWITSKANRKPRFADKYGPMIATAAMGGLMSTALPAGLLSKVVSSGFKALPSVASGNFSPVGLGLSALGTVGGSLGIPSWVVPAVKTGMSLSQMYNQGRG